MLLVQLLSEPNHFATALRSSSTVGRAARIPVALVTTHPVVGTQWHVQVCTEENSLVLLRTLVLEPMHSGCQVQEWNNRVLIRVFHLPIKK
jgi:hypothetical protein